MHLRAKSALTFLVWPDVEPLIPTATEEYAPAASLLLPALLPCLLQPPVPKSRA
jgi:hypothetical protein